MEIDEKKMQRFENAISKLIQNRKQVPLEVLQTKYKAAYTALISEIKELSEWYADTIIDILAIPTNPNDTAGNEWMRHKISLIKIEEHKPGGLYQRIKDVLILTLDWNALGKVTYLLYQRIEKEAWNPYQQRYNRIAPDGRIYNALFRAWWIPDQSYDEGGYWADKSGNFKMTGYAPRTGGQHGQQKAAV